MVGVRIVPSNWQQRLSAINARITALIAALPAEVTLPELDSDGCTWVVVVVVSVARLMLRPGPDRLPVHCN